MIKVGSQQSIDSKKVTFVFNIFKNIIHSRIELPTFKMENTFFNITSHKKTTYYNYVQMIMIGQIQAE